ncbi:RNA pyrophosphohydrolase [Candidatus Hepatincola sp. Pdp]
MLQNYRKGIGAIILNEQGLVFIGKRIDTPNAWQMPQGGLDLNETYKSALLRELQEEIGTNKIEILYKTPLLTYNLPEELQPNFWGGKYTGQQQQWFFTKFLGTDSSINLNAHIPPEFCEWQWIHYQKLIDIIIPFKKPMYEEIIKLGIEYGVFV